MCVARLSSAPVVATAHPYLAGAVGPVSADPTTAA